MDIARFEEARKKLIFAMDVPHPITALKLARGQFREGLASSVGMFKVGLELFMAGGPQVVKDLGELRPIMLDLKLHDIPETVARAVKQGADLGAAFITLHVQQRETLEKAAKVLEGYPGTKLLGVTVLTSMTTTDLASLMQPSQVEPCYWEPTDRALYLACFSYEFGVDGFICSPQEVAALRKVHVEPGTRPHIIVTPGIRPAGTDAGDQKRTGTPAQAIRDGANYIVVGRPIRDAQDPLAAARAIVEEIATVEEGPHFAANLPFRRSQES